MADIYVNPPAAQNFLDWAHDVLVSWEKLRLLYNTILLGWGIVLLTYSWSEIRPFMTVWALLSGSLVLAVAANLAYFLGPLSELYLTVLFRGRWHLWLRLLVFTGGLLLSGAAFIGALLAVLFVFGGGFG